MDYRRVLLGMTILVALMTIVMVIMSQNKTTIQLVAASFMTGNVHGIKNSTRRLSAISSISMLQGSGRQLAKGNVSVITNVTQSPGNQTDKGQPAKVTEKTKPPQQTAKPTNRPLTCRGCFHTIFSNITIVPEVCSMSATGSSKPEMLLMITSSLDGRERRQAIRDTWATVTKGNTGNIRHVFLLGTGRDGKVDDAMKEESARYHDMLISGFVDTYANLTLKTMAAMHYLVDHCADAKFFMKTDQDMYVFVERVLDLGRKNEATLQKSIGGYCHQTGKPWRNPETKYYASVRSYPQSTYPGFCSGTGYISSMNVARKIVETSPDIPFFHLEDVYLALVMRHLGYKLTRYDGFLEGAGVCRNPNRAKRTMTIHEISPQTIRRFWAEKCGV